MRSKSRIGENGMIIMRIASGEMKRFALPMLAEKILRMNGSEQRRQIESLGLSLARHHRAPRRPLSESAILSAVNRRQIYRRCRRGRR